MRLLVFAAVFMILGAAIAAAKAPDTVTRCVAPGDCITVLTDRCGSFLVLEHGVITPMMEDDPRMPANISGFCGFVDPPYYTPIARPAPAYCEGPGCDVPLEYYLNRP